MKRAVAGSLYLVTALITGYPALQLLFTPTGGSFFWWPWVMFGASVLVMVGGIQTIVPRMKQRWSVAIAAAVPLILWIVFIREFLWIFWIFAATLTLLTWGIVAFASALNRNWVAGFAASLTLAVAWLPTSVEAWVLYFSPRPPNPDPTWLLRPLAPEALAVVSLITGIVPCRSPRSEGDAASPASAENVASAIVP